MKISVLWSPVYEIGNYIHLEKIDNFTLKNLLLYPWKPGKNYDYPFSEHTKKGKKEKRNAKESDLKKFEKWLVLSDVHKGYYCKFCPFFVTGKVGGYQKNVPLQSLVRNPVTRFDKLFGKKDGVLDRHDSNQYHKEAMDAAADFLRTQNEEHLSVQNQVNKQNLIQSMENRKKLRKIVETIIFLGKQNIAFRGHRDSGKLEINMPINDGNF